MKKTIRQINDAFKLTDKPLLFTESSLYPYPTIPDDTHNFIDDYNDNFAAYDNYFVKEYGDRVVEYDAQSDSEFFARWEQDLFGTELIYLDAWARLYYALNINYNPVYNVEEHTTTIYGQDQNTDSYGQHQRTSNYGSKETTSGARSDTSTAYSVSYDNGTEKETGKQVDALGQQVNTEGTHIDTHIDAAAIDTHTRSQHTDTVDRSGNIGVVSATELVKQEIALRRNYSFYKNCFLIIINELGAYWDDDPCFL